MGAGIGETVNNAHRHTQLAMVAGDIGWAVTGDPLLSATASEYIVGAARKAVRVTTRNTGRPSVKAAQTAAKKAAKTITTARKTAAVTRLATRPPAKVAKAKVVVQKLKAVPAPKRPAVVAQLAKAVVRKPNPMAAPGKPRALPAPKPAAAAKAFEAPPEETYDDEQPEITDDTISELQDVADVAWSEAEDGANSFEDEPVDEDSEELDDADPEYSSSSMVGWSPMKSIKKAVKKVASGRGIAAIATGGASELALQAYEHRKQIAKTAGTIAKSPYFKAGVAGLAVAFPAVGVPAMAALAVAGKVVDQIDSIDPNIRAAAKRVVEQTYKAAKSGDADAKRGLRAMATVKKQRLAKPAAQPGTSVPAWKQQVATAFLKG